ncbi:MAG: hypothetical protein EOP86_04700 [Verrucomicrobiaceae bacterium]|nr:MAG: hypothetical protein EOP86_04700 [Verrucomicrobiaceae bacterium]
MKRSFIPILLLTVGAFAAGYGASQWMTAKGTPVMEPVKGLAVSKKAPVVAVPAQGTLPVSAFELRLAIAEQQSRVEENRRRLEDMNPDVPAMEERYKQASAMMGKLSQPGLPEPELMELTATLGRADWMPKTMEEYQTAQEQYQVMGERYGKKHPKMAAADEQLNALVTKMTAEAGRVFRETESLSRALEQALPEAREKAAQALRHPERLQPLEQALEESEKRLEELRQRLTEKTGLAGRGLSGDP